MGYTRDQAFSGLLTDQAPHATWRSKFRLERFLRRETDSSALTPFHIEVSVAPGIYSFKHFRQFVSVIVEVARELLVELIGVSAGERGLHKSAPRKSGQENPYRSRLLGIARITRFSAQSSTSVTRTSQATFRLRFSRSLASCA